MNTTVLVQCLVLLSLSIYYKDSKTVYRKPTAVCLTVYFSTCEQLLLFDVHSKKLIFTFTEFKYTVVYNSK